jgi:hypothetical protein
VGARLSIDGGCSLELPLRPRRLALGVGNLSPIRRHIARHGPASLAAALWAVTARSALPMPHDPEAGLAQPRTLGIAIALGLSAAFALAIWNALRAGRRS